MGGPLSSLVAEVYMDHMEKQLLTNSIPELFFHKRYMDDIIGAWSGPILSLHQLLDKMNQFNAAMSFTLEIGGDFLTFLDLTL